jgi:hypothetical protein
VSLISFAIVELDDFVALLVSLILFAIVELDFVASLDERFTRRNDSPIGLVATKRLDFPLKLPPTNAPVWAIDADCAGTGMI